MIAAYITARGRLNLLNGLESIEKAGYIPLYSDTDSIYAQKTDKATHELWNEHMGPLMNDNILGKFKLEMIDDVNTEYGIGCFVAPKLYALKS